MSVFVSSIARSSLYNISCLSSFRSICTSNVQYLYTPTAMGIDGYLQTRKNKKEQFATYVDKFKTKMNEFVVDDKNMIFTEDLKNMIHLADPSDVNLVVDMIKKFNLQNSEYRFGSFVFGPVVMRMFHFLDAPNEALKVFHESSNTTFFDQQVTFQILLDLLYNNAMYDEMYKVFEKVQEKQINMTKYPKYCVVLIMAACYKQNTPESMKYASKLWSDMTNVGTIPLRRSTALFAALALKQGSPHIALEVIPSQKQNYVTIRNIKAIALADGGRLEDALLLLKSVMNIDIPEQKDKHTYFEETIDRVKEAVSKSSDKDIKQEFTNIEKALRDRNLINNKTLEQLLNSDINFEPKYKDSTRSNPKFQNKPMPFGQRQRKLNLQ